MDRELLGPIRIEAWNLRREDVNAWALVHLKHKDMGLILTCNHLPGGTNDDDLTDFIIGNTARNLYPPELGPRLRDRTRGGSERQYEELSRRLWELEHCPGH
ncbi:hypothetical protein IW261DRAFT_1419844 [Armillaria novae-zelandiae]|uniref:Uncharacterized protein n=1 Tax=Armillaria novae-zelandiae TaxID=153914 RepID=A0AA39UF13_9AGAR|nr:hypothetical protein IW261DRAFT_1419844 [Armillaria novae-zelandiae]